MKNLYYFMLCILLLTGLSCGDSDSPAGNEFQASISGKYFISEGGNWLTKTETGWQEMNDAIDGIRICTGTFWFLDENTLLIPAIISETTYPPESLSSKWSQYLSKKGEELNLFIKSGYRYDPATGLLSTDKQILYREKNGCRYYIENINDKVFSMRCEFNESLQGHKEKGYRTTGKESLSPDLRPDSPYKVFDSNDEAITYVKNLLGE
ncbi:MAG: hypothetical protein PHC95_13620 [Parabacteroides sp.]|nr:hypothetical protein [Parabacteroides sp.]